MRPQPQPPRRLRFAFLPLALTAAACSVSPVPEPPADPRPELGGSVVVLGNPQPSAETEYRFRGAAGAVTDADLVWGLNLDGELPAATAAPEPDGSFALDLLASPGDELRLQARRGSLRSVPRDFLLLFQSPEMRVDARPAPVCWDAPLEVDFGVAPLGVGRTRALRIHVVCPDPVTVTAVRLRTENAAFSVSVQALPRAIAVDEFLEVAIEFVPLSAGLHEEVLFVETFGGAPDRRAITLFGKGS